MNHGECFFMQTEEAANGIPQDPKIAEGSNAMGNGETAGNPAAFSSGRTLANGTPEVRSLLK